MRAGRGALIAAILAAAPAAAQSPEDRELSRQHFEIGRRYYDRGEFVNAIVEFRRALDLSGLPELHYNLAQAYERLARWRDALDAYRAYLAGKPGAPDRGFVERRIEFLEARIAEEEAAAMALPPGAEAGAAQAAPEPEPAPEAPPAAPPAAVPAAAPQAEAAAAPPRSRVKRIAGFGAVGAGAALIGAGVVFGVVAQGRTDDIRAANDAGVEWAGYRADYDDAVDGGERAELLQIVGLAAGGAALAAGAVLLVLDARDRDAAVSAAPGGVQVRF